MPLIVKKTKKRAKKKLMSFWRYNSMTEVIREKKRTFHSNKNNNILHKATLHRERFTF